MYKWHFDISNRDIRGSEIQNPFINRRLDVIEALAWYNSKGVLANGKIIVRTKEKWLEMLEFGDE